jgi:hypothetical protein
VWTSDVYSTSSTTTTTTFTETTATTTTTTNTVIQELQGQLGVVTKLLEQQILATDNHVQLLQTSITNVKEQHAADRKADALKIQALEMQLAAVQLNKLDKLEPMVVGTGGPDQICKSAAAAGQCEPSVGADGKMLAINSCCGSIKLNSAECSVNPCVLQRDLEVLKGLLGV